MAIHCTHKHEARSLVNSMYWHPRYEMAAAQTLADRSPEGEAPGSRSSSSTAGSTNK